MIDFLVMFVTFMLLQGPLLFLVGLKDREIRRLNTALLRSQRPEVAAVAERPVVRPDPEPITEEERIQRRARANMFKA